jgi:ABC-type transport system involved in multi-copper enzyme maturation permease subunit
MPGLSTATFLLFRTQISRVWWSRRTLACIALAGAPPAMAWVVARFTTKIPPAAIATHLGWLLLVQVVTPLCALVSGSAVVTEEIEDRTITYLFSRPIPRAAVLLGRWLAALVVVSVLLGLSAVVTTAVASLSVAPGPPVDRGIGASLLAATLLGGAVYSGLFAAAGVFFRHPMIVGLGYAFAVEGFLANLPGRNQALTIQYYLRSILAATGSPSWRDVEGFASSRFETAGRSITTLSMLLLVVLVLACWRISRKEFVLSA